VAAITRMSTASSSWPKTGSPAARGGAWLAEPAAAPQSRPDRSCPCWRTRIARTCAGEGALFVAEELGLEELRRNRRAVDLDERTMTARRSGMNGSGHQILADATFTTDQDRRVRVGDTLDDRPDGAHLRAFVKERTVAGGIGLLHNAHGRLLHWKLVRRLHDRRGGRRTR
jgi:hypothetical protein